MRFVRGIIIAAALALVVAGQSAAGSCDDWEKSSYLHPGYGAACFWEWLMDCTDP